VNLNPQTFVDINQATEADFKKARSASGGRRIGRPWCG